MAVIGRAWRNHRAGPALLAGLMLLASCGSDPKGTETGQIAAQFAGQMRQAVQGRGKTAAPVVAADPEGTVRRAMALTDRSVIFVQIERSGLIAALGEFGRNGAVRTYATAQNQTLSYRSGILVATRGTGDDLMSADTAPAAALIHARRSGAAKHVWRHLDGEGIERSLTMRCTINPAGAQDFPFAGRFWSTIRMDERCVAGPLVVTNNYWVAGDGTIAMSRQWVSRGVGHVTVQLARP